MSKWYQSTTELLAANRGGNPDDFASIRLPYEVGLLARGDFNAVVAYGRSLGIEVEVHSAGGILSQSGWVRAKGRWGDVERFLTAVEAVES